MAVSIVKCQCDHDGCRRYGLSEGTFYQGTGWDKERAQEYADAINYYDSVIAQRNAERDYENEAVERLGEK